MQKKEMIQIGVTACLVVVLGVVLINNSRRTARQNTSAAGQQETLATPSVSSAAPSSGARLYVQLAKEARNMPFKRDPFSKLIEEPPSKLFLNGIVWDKHTPRVIINNEILESGRTINGYTVVEIKENSVKLSDGKNPIELKLEKKE